MPPKTKEQIEEIEALISGANGAEDMVKTSAFCKWIFHTDNLDLVMKKAESYWFLDVIVSHLPRIIKKYGRKADFQVWKMTVTKSKKARVWCEDGNGNKFAAQIIPYTTFPLKSFECLVEKGSLDGKNLAYIIMLPGDR